MIETTGNPYRSLPVRAFWRPAVAEPDISAITEVWSPKFALGQDDPIITAGSCFAAQLGRTLIERGMHWFDAEPAPAGLTADQRRSRHYGEFSFRTGTIYTAAVLRQWLSWAFGRSVPPADAWPDDGRFHDPYRPAIQPEGYASAQDMLDARAVTLAAIRDAITTASCFIITLGLTETWRDSVHDTTYPACPGTVRGTFDPQRHLFHNNTFAEVYADLTEAIALARTANPGLRILLTVSPQPITATATGGHVLVANADTKSLLRAVAGQVARDGDDIDYFPAYELITSPPFRSGFYASNLRAVTPEGVDFVMGHLLSGLAGRPTEPQRTSTGTPLTGGDVCDDAVLDYYAPR
ncbi:GSCFA domain-containing protein [Nocardia sp. NPDC057030]|uniref:GSCFA domain-containing protein n=1 Tax=unclassified Nocardia TaxID=2637762 RepID=UPI00362A94B1